jgi:hypothetical protein
MPRGLGPVRLWARIRSSVQGCALLVRSLLVTREASIRHEGLQRRHQIAAHVGVGVLLDGEGRGGMANKDREETISRRDAAEPAPQVFRDVNEALALRRHAQPMTRLDELGH